jgi:guanylate kinase
VGIFVLPPSFAVLEQRLRGRSKDSDAAIARRLEVARQEVGGVVDYDYVVINDEVDRAVERLQSIVRAERAGLSAMRERTSRIVESFKADLKPKA